MAEANNEGDLRTWYEDGWTARVMKNEEDDGWAVSMTLDGQSEPVLVGPWTMGRDKKNPKPLNVNDFRTLLKAARDVLARHEASQRAKLHKSVTVSDGTLGVVRVDLDIVPDEDDPHARLSAWDAGGELLAEQRVEANFALNAAKAGRWVAGGFGAV
ncbi:MAG: hypothetical protein MUF64_08405 [Polyangiaceae bacterium]|jgi:hypothetical protein|nr:hypothetical protein [Polyangiaceae bacterium]